MFVKKESSSIVVDVNVRDLESGALHTFRARWRLHPVDVSKGMIERITAGELHDQQLAADDLLEVLDITDENGDPQPDDAELRGWLMRWPHTRRALIGSWYTAQHGYAVAAEKN